MQASVESMHKVDAENLAPSKEGKGNEASEKNEPDGEAEEETFKPAKRTVESAHRKSHGQFLFGLP